LQSTIGITFQNLSLLEQSLVHRSYLNENPDFPLSSNERLEFLGDALIGFVVAEELYREFPQLSEGELTKLRAALVCRESLAHLAASLKLGEYLYLGRGEIQSGGRRRQSNLACVFEALVGAILLDQGYHAAKDFSLKLLRSELKRAIEEVHTTDYKSRLQELIQSRQQITPTYRIVKMVGPAHDREFTVEVMAGDVVIGRGSGKSKQIAEKEAARAALESLNREVPSV